MPSHPLTPEVCRGRGVALSHSRPCNILYPGPRSLSRTAYFYLLSPKLEALLVRVRG
jgi:hypothetical protein